MTASRELTVVIDASEEVHELESTQTLEPGYYWRAKDDYDDGRGDSDDEPYGGDAFEDMLERGRYAHKRIRPGMVLLLTEVVEFEGKAHSVHLAMHPLQGKGHFSLLVDAFLAGFVPAPEGEAVRNAEQQRLMQKAQDKQAEFLAIQADPERMREAIREDVEASLEKLRQEEDQKEVRAHTKRQEKVQDLRKTHRRAARRSAAKGNPLVVPRIAVANQVASLIDAGINESGVAELQKLAGSQLVVAQAQSRWLTKQTEAIAGTLTKLAPFAEERAMVALARSSDAIKHAKRIQEGVASLDLYTGKGVDVFEVRTGASAPTNEPLTLLQGKRFMDEELAVWVDVDASFDCESTSAFFRELGSNDDLLEQILPAPRCVCSMAVTRHRRDYSKRDPFAAVMLEIENKRVFLLVRDGQNVYAVYSGSPSHEAADRLFPSRAEMEGLFTGIDGTRITIRDVEFGEATAKFNKVALHYKRFLILLCGLDHREQLFGEFYPPTEQLKFMSLEFQQRYFRFVADDEEGLLLGEERESLERWLARKNAMAQSGSRVFLRSAPSYASPELKRRTSLSARPEQFKTPQIVHQEGSRLYVTLATQSRWDESEPNVKVYLKGNAEGDRTSDDSDWWICIDDVGLDEVRRYRYSRLERAVGVAYLRLFRRLEVHLESELAQQADARAYLLRSAVEHGGMGETQAAAAMEKAIRQWRASRRGASLPGVDDLPTLNEVLTLMLPEGHMPAGAEQQLQEYIEAHSLKPLLLTRNGKSRYMLYVEPTAEDTAAYPDLLHWGWCKRLSLEAGKRAMKTVLQPALVWLTDPLPAEEAVVRRWPGLDTWINKEPEPIRLRSYGEAAAAVRAAEEQWQATFAGGPGAGIPEALFDALLRQHREFKLRREEKYRGSWFLTIPVGLYGTGGRKLNVVHMEAPAHHILWTYGTEAQKERIETAHLDRFYGASSKTKALIELKRLPDWKIAVSDVKGSRSGSDLYPTMLHCVSIRWTTHACLRNSKRDRWTKARGDGKPRLTETSSTLSFNRSFDALMGHAPLQRRAFYAQAEQEARRELRWPHNGHDRAKELAKALRTKRYESPYRTVLSSLVWNPARARSIACAHFGAKRWESADKQASEAAR